VTQTAQPESRDAIARGLIEFNVRHVGEYQWTNLDVYVRDAEGGIVGGLIGEFCRAGFPFTRCGLRSSPAVWA
jgi:hypothetical protein